MNAFIKALIIVSIAAVIVAFYFFGGAEIFTLAYIKSQQQLLTQTFNEQPWLFIGGFFVVYVAVTALSLPIASLLTLLAGAIFGFVNALVLVSFASTVGATLAFLLSRFVFKDAIQNKYSEQLQKFNEGFKKEGLWYLFALRLVPVFPFFMVNLVMGVLPISVKQFYFVSQLGMLPGTAVYIYAGTELGKINELSDITSPSLLVAFTLLGIFPLVMKKLMGLRQINRHG
jgi:uncharacterized membrane protein YdjX (TVP38/TMEM64 family)